MKKKIILFISLLLFPLNTCFAYSNKIVPGGNTIGITVSSKGVMIVGFYKVNGKYNKGNPPLKEGDYITKINNEEIYNSDDLINILNNYKDENNIEVTYIRNNEEYKTKIALYKENNIIKTGLYIKDKISGIGTLSYVDPETNIYGALGHEIEESTTKEKINIKSGSIYKTLVTNIERSINGSPGSKNAKFFNEKVYGDIKKNTKYGIYGNFDSSNKNILNDAIEIKKLSEVHLGKAYIKTVVDKDKIEDYEIEITKINKDTKLKSIEFKVTDERLLNISGGIVQGMSGSPIIQDNYLIGAVTHVLVEDVTKGYGVSIITMLDEGDKLYNNSVKQD